MRSGSLLIARRSRAASCVIVVALFASVLAACGGNDEPSPTAAPTAAGAPTSTVTPLQSASPVRTSASPVTGTIPVGFGPSTVTREQFQQQLRAAFPFEPVGNKGGTIVVGESDDISTVNPILAFDGTTLTVVGAMFETLLGQSPIDGQLVPGLADAWDMAPDGLTYTFHINREAKWHDGVDVTAEDVKFSFDAMLDPNSGSAYTTQVNEVVAAYRVVDADTFELTARDRFVNFLFNGPGSVFIVPKHVWEPVDVSTWSFNEGSTGQDPSRVVGSGPFRFKEWKQGEYVTVIRNDNYYDVVPNIDALTLTVLPDAEAAVLALQNGQIDVLRTIPAAQTRTVIDTPGRKVALYDIFGLTLYGMNLDPEVTSLFLSKEVRQALFYALDREAITENIFFGYGEAAIGTQPSLSAAYAPERMTPAYTFDQTKARELLAQAGWTDTDGDGTVDKDGQQFEFEMLYAGDDATVRQLIAYLQEAWAQVGIKMEPEQVDGPAYSDRLRNHDFEMYFIAYEMTSDPDQTILFSCRAYFNGFNFGRYCNETWDQLNELQKREFDPAARTELLIQLSQIVWDEQPVGPVRFGSGRTGYHERMHNFFPNGYGFLWSLPYVWVDA